MSRRPWIAGAALLTLALAGSVRAATLQIYLANDDHTDYMWIADEAAYQQAFLRMLDFYVNQSDTTTAEASPYQGRFSTDGNFWMWTYEHNRSAAQFNHLMSRVADGHIGMPLNPLVQALGGTPAEGVIRGMLYSGRLERRYGVRFWIANEIENQTLPYGLGALWAGSGAKYTWKGICGCASKVNPFNGANREHEIYWWGGQDGSRLLTKWYSLNNNQALGGYAEAYHTPQSAEDLTAKCNTAAYPYAIAGAFGKGWDPLETWTDEFIAVAKTKTNASRQVMVSNEEDFFQAFETAYGAGLPTVACSFGNEWELYVASLAETSARVKRSLEKLRAGEAMASLVSLKNPGFMTHLETARDAAWMNLGLYWEHDWTGDGPVSRTARQNWQIRQADGVESYVNSLTADASAALGGQIAAGGVNPRFFAFNPLGWSRTDAADFPYSGALPVHVRDVTTGLEVPSQMVTLSGAPVLRIQAPNVPSAGYKVFEIMAGAGSGWANAASITANVMENDFYRLTVSSRGAITSLLDKTRSNREFAGLTGGRAVNDLGAAAGSYAAENVGAVSVTLKCDAASPLQHTSRITLYRDSRRVEIQNEINQNFSATTTWSFAFNLSSPDVWHEEVGAILRAKTLAGGGHYADTNVRYDWLTLNHFADMSGGGVGVTLANADCYFMQLGASTTTTLDTATPQLNVLAGGQVDGTSLGMQNQGGATHFLQRFALLTHDAFNPAEAMRFALEHQNPLVTGAVTGGSDYPADTYSLVSVANPNQLLWALKPAEDGSAQGLVARVWNLSASPGSGSLDFASPILAAEQTTHLETSLGADGFAGTSLPLSLASYQLQTHRVELSGAAATRTVTPTGSATPTATLTRTPTPTPTPSASPSPSRTATVTRTATPQVTPTPTATATPDFTATATPTTTPSGTVSPTGTRTPTGSPTASPSFTVTQTPSATPVFSATPSASRTPTWTATPERIAPRLPTRLLSPGLADGVNDRIDFGSAALEVVVVSVQGREVYRAHGAGLIWDGRASDGGRCPAGSYIARISRADGSTIYQPLVLVK